MVAGFSTWSWTAYAAPEPTTVPSPPEKSVEVLVQELADPKFRTREEASRKIWQIGDPALPALQAVAEGKDPEQAYRARELIRKIQLFITPETDPTVIAIVEQYAKASGREKEKLFEELIRKRAWRQLLKLYSNESSAELRASLEEPLRSNHEGNFGISAVAVIAARESLGKGDADSAREFLEMAPATATGLLALANFHRNQGTLDDELKRALTLKGPHADAWQLALYRASGNVGAAKNAATAAGESKISAVMSVLLGDPIPWLQREKGDSGAEKNATAYTDLAIRRWQGKPIRELDRYPLMLALNGRGDQDQLAAINALYLLGETAMADTAFVQSSKLGGYVYNEMVERVPEALKILGLDPEKPDYTAWVGERIGILRKDDSEEYNPSDATLDLLYLVNFLESRGLAQQAEDAYLKPLLALAGENEDHFTRFLRYLCGSTRGARSRHDGAPALLQKLIGTWAGDNEERWDDALGFLFGEQEEVRVLWEWLAELDPQAGRAERLSGMLSVFGVGRDPAKLREKWVELAWADVQKTPLEKREAILEKMIFLVGQTSDAANQLKLWDMLPEGKREEIMGGVFLDNFTAAGRWTEAAEWELKLIEARAKAKLDPVPTLHARAAAFLRRAGKAEEAAAHDSWVEKLALGYDAEAISISYSEGGDYTRAAIWMERAVRECNPENPQTLARVLEAHQALLMEQGSWLQLAAHAEVRAQIAAAEVPPSSNPVALQILRFQSDLGRALANLKADRAGSVALINQALGNFPSDGSLADDFFPAVRKAGLLKEHDEWFEAAWARMSRVLEQFPDCDNTRNTAAWLASRARLKLDEAEALETRVIALNPEESSYLDTMAEIRFAKGDRKAALEHSARAVNFEPGGPQAPILRRQHERFRTEPMQK
ncbi:hypothetical protein GCM10023212_05620 [Luteolibacter yonseiensis]